jgi:hypothetical protein
VILPKLGSNFRKAALLVLLFNQILNVSLLLLESVLLFLLTLFSHPCTNVKQLCVGGFAEEAIDLEISLL